MANDDIQTAGDKLAHSIRRASSIVEKALGIAATALICLGVDRDDFIDMTKAHGELAYDKAFAELQAEAAEKRATQRRD